MWFVRSKALKMMCMVAWLLALPHVCSAISCYMCSNQASNFLCLGEDNYEECEAGTDTCQTIVSYSEVSAKLEISKYCTKNHSCELQINATKESMPCDTSRHSWVCTSCCYSDGCNVDVAIATHVPSYAGTLAGLLAAYGVVLLQKVVHGWT